MWNNLILNKGKQHTTWNNIFFTKKNNRLIKLKENNIYYASKTIFVIIRDIKWN